jgi:methylated-DNA-[protein]-cysteine S-methyltransferase
MKYWMAVNTPIDDLIVVATGDAIVRIDFHNNAHEDIGEQKNTLLLRAAAAQLRDYFKGTRTEFELPIAQEGTAFQQRVWTMLERIPFGQTTTYGELAKHMKKPLAARAVGMCCARNAIPIIIPCHRVTGTAGLTGFGGEIWRKKWLLKHEAEHSGLFR